MKNQFCPMAKACIHGDKEYPKLHGIVKFYQLSNSVLIEVNVGGLPDTESGFFGFHIHDGNSCKGSEFVNTGSHYNPKTSKHPSHAGDLPPLLLCNGGAAMTVATDRFRIEEIIGRTVVIHSSPDDFHSQPGGNSGTKIGCGEIVRL